MTEFKVWRTIVDWVEDNGGIVFAACPPGSSVYDYKKFCLIDPISKKRDEPDILFALGNTLYIIECKPTLSGSMNRGLKINFEESDIDKLKRIYSILCNGNYNQQLKEIYGINLENYKVKIGIGYSETKNDVILSDLEIVEIIVNENNKKIKIVGN
mgnify:CR=1 FL=1|jgi:hypothetical protein